MELEFESYKGARKFNKWQNVKRKSVIGILWIYYIKIAIQENLCAFTYMIMIYVNKPMWDDNSLHCQFFDYYKLGT